MTVRQLLAELKRHADRMGATFKLIVSNGLRTAAIRSDGFTMRIECF
jgi:hypothetical protein